jgi:hypothetical protein
VLLVLVAASIAFICINGERFFYYWDYSLYQDLTGDTAARFRSSFSDGVGAIWISLGDDYNRLFTLPLVPLVLAFPGSRAVFIVGLAIFYQLPFALAMGAIATELFRGRRQTIFWATALLTLLVPTTWGATLQGYPDAGGATFILLAVWLYLRNVPPGRRVWRLAPAGVALGCAMLFRRHYLYAGIAFFAAAAIHEAALVFPRGEESSPSSSRRFWNAFLELVIMGVATGGTLLILGPAFVKHVFANNYYELYRSYLIPPIDEFWWFLDRFGSGIWLISLCGWLLALRFRAASRGPACFVLLFGFLSLLLWVFVVRQRGVQYDFHVTNVVVLGLAALGVADSERAHGGRWRAGRLALWAGAAAALGLNMFLAFSSRRVLLPAQTRTRQLFAARYSFSPPLVRSDYDEVLRLLDYMHSVADSGGSIYVGGSSRVMNYDIMAHAERDHRQPGQTALAFLEGPQVDSRDWYPLEELIRAQFVIITTPFQHHMAPSEQQVVRVVDVAFTEGWEIARDFVPLPVRFHLAESAEATVFGRMRPTSPATALRTFDEERFFLSEHPPGTQGDWIGLTGGVKTIHYPPDGRRVTFGGATTRQILLYVGAADWHGKRFTAKVHFATPLAAPVRLTLSAVDAAGNRHPYDAPMTEMVLPVPTSADATVSMQTPLPDPACPRLLLTLESQNGAPLPSEISELSLTGSQ